MLNGNLLPKSQETREGGLKVTGYIEREPAVFLKYSFQQELESVFVQHTAFPWVSASPSLRFPPLRTMSSVPSAASLASQQWITYFKRSHLKNHEGQTES